MENVTEIEQAIGCAKYYAGQMKEARVRDEESLAKGAKESILQRASCYDALMNYLEHRGLDYTEQRKILEKHTGETSSSGLRDVILFLEQQFNKIPK